MWSLSWWAHVSIYKGPEKKKQKVRGESRCHMAGTGDGGRGLEPQNVSGPKKQEKARK